MACSPAPNAHWPGEPAGAGASALACPLFDCAANCAGWQGLQTSEPAYWLACCPMAAAAKSRASMPLENDRNLPDKSAAILELPPVNPGLLRRDAPKDGSSGDAQVRIGSAEAVGDVVAFQPQLELDAFLDREHLGQRHIHVDKRGPFTSSYCSGLVRRVNAGWTVNIDVSNQRAFVGLSICGSPLTSSVGKRRKSPLLYVYNALTDQPPRAPSRIRLAFDIILRPF